MYIQFKNFEDLVRLVASSPTPFIQHFKFKDKHAYFVQSILSFIRPLMYVYKDQKSFEKKYVVYNRFKDSVSFSDILGSDGQSVYITILNIENTNLLDYGLKKILEE